MFVSCTCFSSNEIFSSIYSRYWIESLAFLDFLANCDFKWSRYCWRLVTIEDWFTSSTVIWLLVAPWYSSWRFSWSMSSRNSSKRIVVSAESIMKWARKALATTFTDNMWLNFLNILPPSTFQFPSLPLVFRCYLRKSLTCEDLPNVQQCSSF